MATAPKPKGIGAGIKSLPKPALIGIPVAGALAFYLYQRRKTSTAATTAANAAATPAVDTGAATTGTADTGAATTGTADSGGGLGAIAQGQDFSSQIQALQGQASTEITDLDSIKSQQTQLLSTENKDLSVDNKNLATSTKDLASDTKDLASDTADYSVDRQDLLTDNSGIAAPVKKGGSTSAPKKPVTPAAKLPKPMATPKVTPAKIAPTKKTTFTAPRPAATVSGGRAPIKAPPKPVVKAPAKKK